MEFQTLNIPSSSSSHSPILSSHPPHRLNLSAPFPTDIWRKPPSTNVFTAPIIYHALPIRNFLSARVSVTGDWKTLYDQGGLVVVLPGRRGEKGGIVEKRWVKAGIEFYGGKPRMSVVAAEGWADWSLSDLNEDSKGGVTVDIERLKKEDGEGSEGEIWSSVLRVSKVRKDGVKTPVREITWAFWDENGDEEDEMWVGVYAAKPTGDEREKLEVSFEGFEVDRKEE